MNKKKLKKGAFIASLAAIVIVGTTAAFLTSSDSADNSFEIAEVELVISESFKPDQVLAAGQIIQKEPYVKNTGSVPQIFFVEVSVPCMKTTLLDKDGKRIAPNGKTISSNADYKQLAEIFDLLTKDNNDPTVWPSEKDSKYGQFSYIDPNSTSAGWVYLKQTESEKVYANKSGYMDGTYNTYLFGYSAFVEPDSQTVPIFTDLRLRSMVDEDITGDTVSQVTIRAYTVQKDSLEIALENKGTKESQYDKTDLEKLYNVISNKEGRQP